MEEILNVGFKIVYVIGWLISLIILFCARARLKRIEKGTKKTEAEMIENKENQTEKEKELKTMGKFLCDRCGRETEVRDARVYKQFDLCATCADEITAAENEYKRAEATAQEAERRAQEARDKIERFNYVLNKVSATDMPAPIVTGNVQEEKPAAPVVEDSDVLKKLGL